MCSRLVLDKEPPFGDEDERRFSRFQVEVLAKDTYCAIPAKAGIQNRLNPAFGGTGFRVALRPVYDAVEGFACPE
jgi:hypothetical protein